MEKFEQVIENEYWRTLEEEEGITKEDVDFVMLDIGFTPVIPFRNGTPHNVVELRGGNYMILGKFDEGVLFESVSPERLKVMRFRYLMNRKNPLL